MRTIFAVLIVLVLSACSNAPSADAVQTAVAQTMAAAATDTPAVTSTFTPAPTSTPTVHPTHTITSTFAPTNTQRPVTPTTATTTYILENGWCMLSVTPDQVEGKDPKTVEWCNLEARKQIQLAANQYMELKLNNLDGRIQVYCALFSADGVFIMSNLDTTGTGRVTCPHE